MKKEILLHDEQINEENKFWSKETVLNLILHKNTIECIISFAVIGTVMVGELLFLYLTLQQLLRQSCAVEIKFLDDIMEFETEWMS